MKRYWGSGGVAPLILAHGIIWRWVVSFTLRPPYSWYPSDERLGGSQSRSGRAGEEKNAIIAPAGIWELVQWTNMWFSRWSRPVGCCLSFSCLNQRCLVWRLSHDQIQTQIHAWHATVWPSDDRLFLVTLWEMMSDKQGDCRDVENRWHWSNFEYFTHISPTALILKAVCGKFREGFWVIMWTVLLSAPCSVRVRVA
jgi:hypothetical protein